MTGGTCPATRAWCRDQECDEDQACRLQAEADADALEPAEPGEYQVVDGDGNVVAVYRVADDGQVVAPEAAPWQAPQLDTGPDVGDRALQALAERGAVYRAERDRARDVAAALLDQLHDAEAVIDALDAWDPAVVARELDAYRARWRTPVHPPERPRWVDAQHLPVDGA